MILKSISAELSKFSCLTLDSRVKSCTCGRVRNNQEPWNVILERNSKNSDRILTKELHVETHVEGALDAIILRNIMLCSHYRCDTIGVEGPRFTGINVAHMLMLICASSIKAAVICRGFVIYKNYIRGTYNVERHSIRGLGFVMLCATVTQLILRLQI